MAILCVLSHGKEGVIYGSDGHEVAIDGLERELNNDNCKVMVGKPKLVIIQACQGSKFYLGILYREIVTKSVYINYPNTMFEC